MSAGRSLHFGCQPIHEFHDIFQGITAERKELVDPVIEAFHKVMIFDHDRHLGLTFIQPFLLRPDALAPRAFRAIYRLLQVITGRNFAEDMLLETAYSAADVFQRMEDGIVNSFV